MAEIIDIDGSVLEGGGQILRMSVALSALTGTPVRVSKIRAGRSKPGLAAQHLKGIELVAQMCQARLQGASIGSTEIVFVPGKLKGGHYVADTKTAGSVSLLLQVALPCALFASGPVTFDLHGGTNADMAPQIDYMGEVFRYMLQKFGGDFALDVHKRGYFPRGGGHVSVRTEAVTRLNGACLTQRGRLVAVRGWSYVAGKLPTVIAEEMSEGAKAELRPQCGDVIVDIESYREDPAVARDNGSGIIVTAELSSGCVLGADGIVSRGARGREVGAKAGAALALTLHAAVCVDAHTQDQLIIYMCVARGRSSIRAGEVSLHTRTAIHVAELITKVKFTVRPDGAHNIIECDGLGLENKNLPPE